MIEILTLKQKDYLIYRGSIFDAEGNLLFAKDDALAYSNGIQLAIDLINEGENNEQKQ